MWFGMLASYLNKLSVMSFASLVLCDVSVVDWDREYGRLKLCLGGFRWTNFRVLRCKCENWGDFLLILYVVVYLGCYDIYDIVMA